MTNLKALFKISHGMYLTGAKDEKGRLIGSCVDAVMVIEPDPAQIMISLCKTSYTCENVIKNKKLTLSILGENTPFALIQKFGMTSSRENDKWEGEEVDFLDNLPIYKKAVAGMSLEIIQTIETPTHFVFLCSVIQIKEESMEKEMNYNQYQEKKNQQGQNKTEKKWKCAICGYVYEGEVPFEELPEDWICPLCGQPKSVFVQE